MFRLRAKAADTALVDQKSVTRFQCCLVKYLPGPVAVGCSEAVSPDRWLS